MQYAYKHIHTQYEHFTILVSFSTTDTRNTV